MFEITFLYIREGKVETFNLLCILINVTITALNIKLYTEYFKDRSARARDNKERGNL